MKRSFFLLCFLFLLSRIVFSDFPDRRSRSDVDYISYLTTGVVPSSPPVTKAISITSGTVKIWGIYIASPGVNSQLSFYDNYLVGDTSNQIGVSMPTNSRDFIPFNHETSTRGLVMTSTCTNCSATWSAPSFNVHYKRVQ